MQRTISEWTALKWVAAAAAAAITVTACAPLQLGAVAIYGNQRITTSTLSAEVANLNVGYQADKSKAHLGYGVAALPREALSWMLRFAAREQLAVRQGIVVTAAQSQQALTAIAASVRQGGGGTLAEAAVSAGLPPNLLPELGRYAAIQTQLQNRLDQGVQPKTSAAATAISVQFNQLQCRAAKTMNIKVNPQYGVLDYGTLAQPQYTVVQATSKLSASKAASTAPTAPGLTPPC